MPPARRARPETVKNLSWVNNARAERSASFGEARYGPRGSFGPRTQRDYQIVVVLSGEMRVEIDGVERDVPIGFAGILRPGHRERFEFAAGSDTVHLWCAIRPDQLEVGLRRAVDAAPFLVPLTPGLRALLDLGLSTAPAQGRAAARVLDAFARAALAECVRAAEAGSAIDRPGTPHALARAFLSRNYARRDALRAAAQAASVTPQHLARGFRKTYGVTPGHHLWDCRINAGLRMLQDTGHSVGEIADRCGFSNPFHFSRLIHARTGLSPKAWRQKVWGT
jgi:AraC-like DNA-binding protein